MSVDLNHFYASAALNAWLSSSHDTSMPPTVYIGLFLDVGLEVSGGGYARVSVPNTDAWWGHTSPGTNNKSNVQDIVFPSPTADWGYVQYVNICPDATTSWLYIMSVPMVPYLFVPRGFRVKIPNGYLSVGFS